MKAVAVGEATALFCERTQQLSELNETAHLIWAQFAAGHSFQSVTDHLCTLGMQRADAAAFVQPLLDEWLRIGYVTPTDVLARAKQPPAMRLVLDVAGLIVELRLSHDSRAASVAEVFGHLQVDRDDASLGVSVVDDGDVDHLFVEDLPVGVSSRHQTMPAIKLILRDAFSKMARAGFITHGALLSSAGKRVFVGGAPGAGKTTLTLALANEGFAYGGDDVVHIYENGEAEGVAFAAAAKSGAWGLLADQVPGLTMHPVHERADRQLVRYVTPAILDRDGPRPIDVLLLLDRREGAPARFEPMRPLDALCALLESGYSERHSVAYATIEGLARHLSKARCGRLVYEDLAGAVDLVKALVNE